jgi:hypothetical protein
MGVFELEAGKTSVWKGKIGVRKRDFGVLVAEGGIEASTSGL